MKSRSIRYLSVLSIALLAALPAVAVERLCSVYVESITALQQQVQQAAEVFESPELGMFPMMMTMMVPGGSQVNVSEPIAFHTFDIGGGKTGRILELTPATTIEMFLKALTAASGKPLEPAVNGIFTFDGGVAQMLGPKLLLARNVEELNACTGAAVPALPPMPAIEGAVRLAASPSAAVPLLNDLRTQWNGMNPMQGKDAAQAKEAMELMFGLYSRTLAQMDIVEIGLAVQPEGLVIRKRLAARSGSTVEGIFHSMTPVSPEYLSFINAQSLFSVASGSFVVPEQLKHQIVTVYRQMMKFSPAMANVEDADLEAMLKQSVAMLGAAMAFEAQKPEGGRLLMLGAAGVSNAAAYIEEMVAMMKTPTYQNMISGSGMQITEPVQRAYKDASIYTWKFAFDEAALRKTVEAQSPGIQLGDQSFEAMKIATRVLGDVCEYAAASQGLAFGMGSPAMVEQAVDRLATKAPVSVEALRIQKLLSPAAVPVAMGRVAIVDIARLAMKMQCGTELPEEVRNAPAGEGIVFVDWIEGGDVKSSTLIPAADVKALRMMSKAMPTCGKDEFTGAGDDTDNDAEDYEADGDDGADVEDSGDK